MDTNVDKPVTLPQPSPLPPLPVVQEVVRSPTPEEEEIDEEVEDDDEFIDFQDDLIGIYCHRTWYITFKGCFHSTGNRLSRTEKSLFNVNNESDWCYQNIARES